MELDGTLPDFAGGPARTCDARCADGDHDLAVRLIWAALEAA